MSKAYKVGRWGVFKNPTAQDPVGLILDGIGMPAMLGGPIFKLDGDGLFDDNGIGGFLAPFRTGEWIVNYGVNDLGYVLRRLPQ